MISTFTKLSKQLKRKQKEDDDYAGDDGYEDEDEDSKTTPEIDDALDAQGKPINLNLPSSKT